MKMIDWWVRRKITKKVGKFVEKPSDENLVKFAEIGEQVADEQNAVKKAARMMRIAFQHNHPALKLLRREFSKASPNSNNAFWFTSKPSSPTTDIRSLTSREAE